MVEEENWGKIGGDEGADGEGGVGERVGGGGVVGGMRRERSMRHLEDGVWVFGYEVVLGG